MHGLSWDDFRYLLALSRKGSVSKAAKYLGVNESTVSRRLKTVEDRLGLRIFDQTPAGYCLTEIGEGLIRRLKKAELEIEAAVQFLATGNTKVAGKVRLTSVPMIVSQILVPNLDELLSTYPDLEIELIAEPSDLSLLQREADIAIRLARPAKEIAAIAQKIGMLKYGVYAAKTAMEEGAKDTLPWIGYEKEMSHLPQAKWIDARCQIEGNLMSQISFNDAEMLLGCLKSGQGKSLLPVFAGENHEELERMEIGEDLLEREIWLLTHPDHRKLENVQVVVAWIKRCMSEAIGTSRQTDIA